MSSGNLFEDSRLKGEESHDEPNEDEPIEGDSNTLGGTKHTRRKEIADVKLKLTLLQYYPLENIDTGRGSTTREWGQELDDPTTIGNSTSTCSDLVL